MKNEKYLNSEKEKAIATNETQIAAPAVTIKDMGVKIGHYDILKNVSATIPSKKQTVIIGPNGAGKSTLVLALLSELSATGTIVFSPEKPRLGFVPQRLDFDRHLPLTVAEFMSLGRSVCPLWFKIPKKVRESNLHYLELVQAQALVDRPLGSLSGGETQRVFLARALMQEPDILILDEPASGVDVFGEQLLCEILETFKKDFTIIMVSHDLATAKAHGDWIICLNRTVIAEGSPKKIFRPSILSKAFGIHQSVLFGEDFPEDNETSVDNQILKDEKADKEELNIDKTKGAEVTLTEGKNKGTNCCSCGENHRV